MSGILQQLQDARPSTGVADSSFLNVLRDAVFDIRKDDDNYLWIADIGMICTRQGGHPVVIEYNEVGGTSERPLTDQERQRIRLLFAPQNDTTTDDPVISTTTATQP